jgi:ribosomal protein S18 acetylase RimI-like enzyme
MTQDREPAPFRVRPVEPADWERLRDLRLEMLEDTPKAFLERLEHARRRPDRDWRRRTEREVSDPTSWRFVAESSDGALVATMGCYLADGARATVFGVYVTPAWRSRGVAEALLDVVERFAAERFAAAELFLLVHEENERARAFYRRQGFAETGRTTPYELEPSERELEMVRAVRR